MGLLFAMIMICGLLLTPACVIAYLVYQNKQKMLEIQKAQSSNRPKPIITEQQVTEIIYGAIEREWTYRVKFHYKLKDIRMPDFEFELDYLVKRVIKSIAPDLMRDMTYYYNLDDLIALVSHASQILLLEYIDAHKPKSSKIRI